MQCRYMVYSQAICTIYIIGPGSAMRGEYITLIRSHLCVHDSLRKMSLAPTNNMRLQVRISKLCLGLRDFLTHVTFRMEKINYRMHLSTEMVTAYIPTYRQGFCLSLANDFQLQDHCHLCGRKQVF